MGYKFGIVGLGLIADFHARAIEAIPGAEVYSCMSRSEEKAETFSKKYKCRGYTNLTQMVQDPQLDIVTICTPSGYHMEPALEIINAGKHVIVEKPLEVTLERCDKILTAAENNNIRLATVFPSRFSESAKQIKMAIDIGRFGDFILGDAYVKWLRTQEYYDQGGWHGTIKMDGGGALMNQSIHAIDLLQWFMGPVKSVIAYTAIRGHKRIETEDIGVAVLKFENGALGVIEGSTAVYPGYLKKIEISGTNGSIILEESEIKSWNFKKKTPEDKLLKKNTEIGTNSGGGISDPGAIDFKPHQRQFEDFLESLDSGKRSVVEGNEGRKAVEIILAIYESAGKGSEVFLN